MNPDPRKESNMKRLFEYAAVYDPSPESTNKVPTVLVPPGYTLADDADKVKLFVARMIPEAHADMEGVTIFVRPFCAV